ncbi:MAG: hypothetical protein GXY55_21335 [Phycisphaerae bacterium]|nr:hypothetical protein [Phycisphaerae bacterium]
MEPRRRASRLLGTLAVVVCLASSAQGAKLCIDPGHGGSDPGAVGNGLQEKDVNLSISLKARDLFNADSSSGWATIMTRDTDVYLTLAARTSYANSQGVDRFICVHSNSFSDSSANGTETYHHTTYNGTSHDMATKVQNRMYSYMQTTNRGVKQADFHVLRETSMPATLTEVAFISNPSDAAKLGNADYQQQAARAILHGLQEHYGISVHDPQPPGPSGSWTHSSGEFNPTQFVGDWEGWTSCDDVYSWWTTTRYGAERFANWHIGWNFRGRFKLDAWIPCENAGHGCQYRFQRYDYDPNAGNPDNNRKFSVALNQCATNRWNTIDERDWDNDRPGGVNIGSYDVYDTCSTATYQAIGASKVHWYGHKWEYFNDWVCLGGYGSASVTETHGFDEGDLYLYPAVHTDHGNVFAYNGHVPGRVQTGDCNWQNTLDFKGNATSHGGGDNMSSYAFAWVYAPEGAGPKFLVGADDQYRVWRNGTVISEQTSGCVCARDGIETGGISMPAGWSRVLLKVRNDGGAYYGTISLRNGGTRSWNEPSVTLHDLGGGLKSWSVGYEQDDWHPRIDVASFYSQNDPKPNDDFYGNSTTVTASGTASGGGPVPFWKVMHFESGFGLAGDTNFADVSSSGSNWSHSQTGVTGHRRFHFFSVSKSRRTSFQDSGKTGGWAWADDGHGNYMDIFIDNVAPEAPSFASAAAGSTTQVNLAWAIPADQGVGIEPGSTEYASEGGDHAYRRGDVGVRIYRNGSSIGEWGTGTSFNDVGLAANTAYTYTIEARDNTGEGRGSWHNTTGQQGSTVVHTLALDPAVPAYLSCDRALGTPYPVGTTYTFSNPGGFGPGSMSKYKYVWNTSPTHTWTDTEAEWSSGALPLSAEAGDGGYYLHVRSYNADGVPSGTCDFGPFFYDGTAPACAITKASPDPTDSSTVTFDINFTEPVSDFGVEDITLGGTAPGAVLDNFDGSGASYSVDVTGISGNGTVSIEIAAGAALDDAGNPSAGCGPEVYTIQMDTTPPALIGALSRRTHGAAGDMDIDVAFAEAVECRSGGPTLVIVTFDEAIEGVGGLEASDVSTSSGSPSTVAITDNVLEIGLSGVANAANLEIGFPGISDSSGNLVDATICFAVLAGDVNGDRAVNIFDLVQVRNQLNQPVTGGNSRADVTADGSINIFDLVNVRNNLNQAVPACP